MSTKKQWATPPSSDIAPSPRLPPSPPLSPKRASPSIAPVDRLIGVLHLLRAGRLPSSSDQRTISLTPSQYDDFQLQIEREGLTSWYDAKVRYDYDGKRYTLRMPSATHERFIASVEDRIFSAVEDLADRLSARREDATARALRGIYKGRSTTLELNAPRLENSSQESDDAQRVVRRSPDATFYCNAGEGADAELPALVVEVSYSQQRKDLPRLAESYIVDSRHAIRCVVGLGIPYAYGKGKEKDKTATVSVWRPDVEDDEGEEIGVCKCDVDGDAFRDGAGSSGHGEVQLSIADLLPVEILDTLPTSIHEESITISYADLTGFLNNAERKPATMRATSLVPKKFRKRMRSPSEGLSDGREAKYLPLEEAELERERDADGEWVETVPRRRSKRRAGGRAATEGS